MIDAVLPTPLPGAAEAVLSALRSRWACKRFDSGRRVDDSVRRAVLEAGRLSPSSFGLEPWAFAVAEGAPLKKALRAACFDQESLDSADFVACVLVRSAVHYAPDAPFVLRRAERFPGGVPVFTADYRGYYEFLRGAGRLEAWARAQGYLASMSMMAAAAAAGVDSCAIEGFAEDRVLAALGLDARDWLVSLLIPFGYAGEETREKIREPYEGIVYSADSGGPAFA